MYVREQTFRTGFIKCKTSLRGSNLAKAFSKLEPEDIARAARRRDNEMSATGVSGNFLRAVTTSCRPVAYSSEAAAHARRQLMAYCDFFGLPSLFVSMSPDDAMAFRIKLYARSKEEQSLPSLSWTDDECILDFDYRKQTRLRCPGLCSLEFQHVMQIIWKEIVGWNFDSQTGKRGVLGIPIAVRETDEEQSKKTLHSHWLVWRFNEHAWEHRAACFKKGIKCRAALPKKIQDKWELCFDESEIHLQGLESRLGDITVDDVEYPSMMAAIRSVTSGAGLDQSARHKVVEPLGQDVVRLKGQVVGAAADLRMWAKRYETATASVPSSHDIQMVRAEGQRSLTTLQKVVPMLVNLGKWVTSVEQGGANQNQ